MNQLKYSLEMDLGWSGMVLLGGICQRISWRCSWGQWVRYRQGCSQDMIRFWVCSVNKMHLRSQKKKQLDCVNERAGETCGILSYRDLLSRGLDMWTDGVFEEFRYAIISTFLISTITTIFLVIEWESFDSSCGCLQFQISVVCCLLWVSSI